MSADMPTASLAPKETSPIKAVESASSADPRESFGKSTEASIRRGFVRKVYCILSCQLAFTCGVMALFVFIKPVKQFAIRYHWLYILSLCVLFALILVLVCVQSVRRKFPLNLILLGLFTAVQSFALGVVSARFKTDAVLIAVGVTAVVVLALTLFALQSKIDFTYLSGILFVLVLVLILFGILCAVFRNRYLTLVYACAGALLFSVYLVVDTQLMLGGKHKYSLSPEEYVFAALNLYLDIINLFIFILYIVAGVEN